MSDGVIKTRRFKVKESMESEGRKFYKGETYEAIYKKWDEETIQVSLFAENGYFNFSDELFERVIVAWELEEQLNG